MKEIHRMRYETFPDFEKEIQKIYARGCEDIRRVGPDNPTPGMRLCSALWDVIHNDIQFTIIWPSAMSNNIIDKLRTNNVKVEALHRGSESKDGMVNNGGAGIPRGHTLPPIFLNKDGMCIPLIAFMRTCYYLMAESHYQGVIYIIVDMGMAPRRGPYSIVAMSDLDSFRHYYNDAVSTYFPAGKFEKI